MDDIDFRREMRIRRRKRQQKRRRMYFFTFLAIIAIIILIFVIKFSFKLKHIKNSQPTGSADNSVVVNDVVYPQAPEQTADLLTAINKKDDVKTCYLTFDDGPTKSVTLRILDTLRRYNIKATFFTVGSLLEANPDMARRVYDEGHLLANHSYSHNYSDLYATQDSFMSEINTVFDLITKITGESNYPKIFRFPGGGYNAGSYGEVKQIYKELLKSNGIRYCDWNALNGDAEGKSRTVEELVERVKKTTSGKEDVVILMHDAAAKSTTADALPYVIEYLIGEGYTFKTLASAPRV